MADGSFGRVGWGIVGSAMSAGLVAGGLALLRFRPRHPMRLGVAGMLCEVPLLLVLGLAPTVWLLVLVAFVAGVGVELFSVAWETALQQHIPPAKLSRVASYDMLGSLVALPAGQLLAGPLADAFGVREVITVGAVVYAAVIVVMLADRSVWTLRRADEREPEPVTTPA